MIKERILKKESGVTLTALIITIIVLIILVVVVLNLAFNQGIVEKAEEGITKYDEKQARELLEMALIDLKTDKVTDKKNYNEEEYINNELSKYGMIVEENTVYVKGWEYEIDRSLLMIK